MDHKVLFCATVDYHFKAFHLPYMKWFKEQGWGVDVAAAGTIDLPYSDNKYNIPIERSPLRRSNISAYKQLKDIMNKNNYSIIHCHTPLGGVLARMAARQTRKKGTKVMYTAHGFHFCQGVPLLNWLVYYPIERYLSHHTDSLITINQEDYHLATKHRFPAKEIEHISGVGVDTEQFKPIDAKQRSQMKVSAGYAADDLLLFHAGEFNKNKNQQFLLYAMVHLLKKVPNIKLILAGEGVLQESCKRLADRLGISQQVTFLGFRNDMDDIMPMFDIAVAASLREGLPVNIMEAMACELPIVALDNRGHRELIHNGINGWLVTTSDTEDFAKKIQTLTHKELRNRFGKNGRKIIVGKYSTKQILKEKSHLYKTYMGEGEDVSWIVP